MVCEVVIIHKDTRHKIALITLKKSPALGFTCPFSIFDIYDLVQLILSASSKLVVTLILYHFKGKIHIAEVTDYVAVGFQPSVRKVSAPYDIVPGVERKVDLHTVTL